MAKKEHAHRYMRVKLGKKGYTVYRCVKPGCSHYVNAALVLGKMYECWRCGREYPMNQKTAQLKKPHCASCTRMPGSEVHVTASISSPIDDNSAEGLVKRVLRNL